jgi:predicted metal-dependent hydrolase
VARPGVLHVDDLEVEVTVRRVKRMNVRVHPPDGAVRLSVPPRTSERAVVRFVRESRAWIDHHRARIADEELHADRRPRPPDPCGVSGEVWWRFGRALRLEVVASSGPVRIELLPTDRLVARVPDPDDGAAVLTALDRWQRRELRAAAKPLLDHWAGSMGVRYGFLGVRRMVTRWGTCVPARGRIWLNVALVTRPPALLEYVVVHELAHLREASHGRAFQALMDEHLPDWRERRVALDRSA